MTMAEKDKTDTSNYTWRELVAGDIAVWLKIWKPGWTPAQGIQLKDAVRLTWNYTGLRATLLYRLSHHLWLKHIPVLPGILTRLNITLHGFDVPCIVKIGPGLYVPHPVGTVIMAQEIGANVTLISGITIGMRNEPDFPLIGNNVFIGAGARVLGNLVIGDNVNIGANAVVVKDIPANCTAVGIPAKILANQA
ncbi:MAG: serine acetyltransferase [Chloroflexota bacterium]|nr:serine acetyltransferase [Chloroflexota bacterium]